jgi:hypothetical protein
MNVYIHTKWKILWKGCYFWLSSAGASAIGELAFSVITIISDYLGIYPLGKIAEIISISYGLKLLGSIILVGPASLATVAIKRTEVVDVYATETNFNPFTLQTKV